VTLAYIRSRPRSPRSTVASRSRKPARCTSVRPSWPQPRHPGGLGATRLLRRTHRVGTMEPGARGGCGAELPTRDLLAADPAGWICFRLLERRNYILTHPF
jgi:hypothetical protein